MEKKFFWISIFAIAISFAGGFLLANAMNRSEMAALRSENERLKAPSTEPQNEGGLTLAKEEIDRKLAEAEQNAGDFQYQKNLGLALYRYAAMKQDPELLAKVVTVLDRAASLDPKDQAVTIGLGNAHFDIGYFSKNNDSFARAREYYDKALIERPDDAEIRTDVALTYYLQQPADLDKAIETFKLSLKADPKHEKTLQFLIQAYIKQQKPEEAAQFLEELKKANPASPSIAELSTMIAQSGQPQ